MVEKITSDFLNNYFHKDPLLAQGKISLTDFFSKTEAEKLAFIKNWAISQINELKKIKVNLQSSLDQINIKIALYEKETK